MAVDYTVSTHNKYGIYMSDDIDEDPSEIIRKLEEETKKEKAKEKAKTKADKKAPSKPEESSKSAKDSKAENVSSDQSSNRRSQNNQINDAKPPRFSNRGRRKEGGGFNKENDQPSGEDEQQSGGFGNRGRGGFGRGGRGAARGGFGSSDDKSADFSGEDGNRGRGRGGNRGFGRGRGRGENRGGGGFNRGGFGGGFGTPSESKPEESFDSGAAAQDEEERPVRRGFTDRPARGGGFNNRGGFGGSENRGGFGAERFSEGGEDRPRGRGRGGARGGRGRGFGGENRGGFGNRREYDRHSGSDKTGVKAMDKREGGGARNWGNAKDDIEEAAAAPDASNLSSDEPNAGMGGDWSAAVDAEKESAKTAAEEKAQAEAMMTLDEYKAKQKEERQNLKDKLHKDESSTRKANEGDQKVFKNMTMYKKERLVENDDEEEEDEDEAAAAARAKKVLHMDIRFSDRGESGSGGRGRDRGERGGGRGRGGFERGGRGGGFNRGRGGRGGFEEERSGGGGGGGGGGHRAANLNLTDDDAFPVLGGP